MKMKSTVAADLVLSTEPATGLSCDREQHVEYDSLSEAEGNQIRFRVKVFLEQLAIQLTIPISVVPVLLIHGMGAVHNLVLLPPLDRLIPFVVYWQTITHIAAWWVCVYLWMSTQAKARNATYASTLAYDVLSTMIFLIFHRISVSIKYAYMEPEWYERFMRERIPEQSRWREMLIGGWLLVPHEHAHMQVEATAEEMDEDPNEAIFTLSRSQARRLRESLLPAAKSYVNMGDNDSAGEDGTLQLTACQMAAAITIQASEASKRSIFTICAGAAVGGFIMMFTPLTLRAIYGLPLMGATSRDTTIIAAHYVGGIFWFPAIMLFMSVAALDSLRRAQALGLLGTLITRPSTRLTNRNKKRSLRTSRDGNSGSLRTSRDGNSGEDSNDKQLVAGSSKEMVAPPEPIVTLDSIEHMHSWQLTRFLIIKSGVRYQARGVALVSLGVVLFGIIATLFLVYIFAGVDGRDVDTMTASMVLLHAAILPPIAVAALGLSNAAKVYEAASHHATLLVRERTAVRVMEVGGAEAMAPRTGTADERTGAPLGPMAALMEAVERSVLAEASVNPVRILGFDATPALTKSFLGAVISFEAGVLSVFGSRLLGS